MKGGRSRMKKDDTVEKTVKGNREIGRIGENERIKENMELASVLMLVKIVKALNSSVGSPSHAGSTRGTALLCHLNIPDIQVTVIFIQPTISTFCISQHFTTCHCRILSTAQYNIHILMSTHKFTF
jgi:hypothetical protein